MTVNQLRDLIHEVPFKPFTIHLSDNRAVHVPHPDFITVSGPGGIAVVTSPDNDSVTFIDIPLVVHLVVNPLAARATVD